MLSCELPFQEVYHSSKNKASEITPVMRCGEFRVGDSVIADGKVRTIHRFRMFKELIMVDLIVKIRNDIPLLRCYKLTEVKKNERT